MAPTQPPPSLGRREAALGLTALLAAPAAARAAPAPAPAPDPSPEDAALIRGSIDAHVHSLPDDRPRIADMLDIARLAARRGMRGIVFKNHNEPTAGLASLVQKVIPELQVFGGVALNRSVGGINPAAVEHMAKLSGGAGRIVWLPTYDSERHVAISKENRPFVRVTRDGALLPEVREVIALCVQHDLALATGHSAPQESLLILKEARAQKVKRTIVTHALFQPVFMTMAEMQAAAELGALIEFCGGAPNRGDGAERMKTYAAAMKALGPARCLASTDLGQPGNPLPPDGFLEFLVALRKLGFTPAEIDLVAKQNPARLLGL